MSGQARDCQSICCVQQSRVHRWSQRTPRFVWFSSWLSLISENAARAAHTKPLTMLLSRLASRAAASGTRALLARASQRSAQRAPRRLLSDKPAEKAAEKAAAPEAKPGWWSTVWNQISGAPRHRRDVDNLTHWSISTQVEQRRVLGRPRRARRLGHDGRGDLRRPVLVPGKDLDDDDAGHDHLLFVILPVGHRREAPKSVAGGVPRE